MKTLFSTLILLLSSMAFSQVGINNDNSQPDPSAMLDVKATDRGVLIPRLSNPARDQIPSPAIGLLIFNTTTSRFNYYNGTYWCQLEITFVSSTIGSLNPGGGVSINASPNLPPDNSAILDVNNSTRGILIPRTTPNLITSPSAGLIIYNTSTNLLNYYDGVQWNALCGVSTGVTGAGGSQNLLGVAINTNGSSPHHSAILDVSSTSKGILIPRVTNAQRDAILPVTGLVVYNSSANEIEYYNGSSWNRLNTNFITAPVTGTHIPAQTLIIWNWNPVSGATGYRWNTTNSFATAIDMGPNTSKTETGLGCNTPYSRFVWAYNNCGNSTSTTINQTTSLCSPPTVTTNPATNITGHTATSGGNVTSDGGTPVLDRGVCWCLNWDFDQCLPTIEGNHTHDGSGMGTFVSQITGLALGYPYKIRAYASNSVGLIYGNEETFTTLDIPYVETSTGINVTAFTATYGGEVYSDGGDPVTERGVCWSTSTDPTVNGSHTSDGSGLGTFVSNITGLIPGTHYYIRAYATNSLGTGYGSVYDFRTPHTVCPDIMSVTYEGKTYNTIIVGSQCWFKENLNVGTRINGSQNQSNNGIIEKYCYSNDELNCDAVGGLYQWNETMQYTSNPGTQGICPYGWHIPTDAEWTTMTTYLGGTDVAGGKMKETGYVLWMPPNTGASNESGFTALPAGQRNTDATFSDLFWSTHFWSSNIVNPFPYYRFLTYDNDDVYRNRINGTNGYSVRCLRDTCGMPVTYEGKTYNTVKIGTQCWFRENLNVGTIIPVTQNQQNNGVKEKYCYDNDESNCDVYGGLYQWNEMMNYINSQGGKGMCPSGWHVPTETESVLLINRFHTDAGGKLKEAGTEHWQSPNSCASNESGFTSIPGGWVYPGGTLGGKGYNASFWTSSEYPDRYAKMFVQKYNDCYAPIEYWDKYYGYSVRCLRDD